MTENWRYAQPGQADVVIITTSDSEGNEVSFGAMIAELPSKGGDLLFKIGRLFLNSRRSVQAAQRNQQDGLRGYCWQTCQGVEGCSNCHGLERG